MAPPDDNVSTPVPFPRTESMQQQPASSTANPTANSPITPTHRSRTSTNASTASTASRIRAASIKMMEASPPPGMWAATGTVTSKAPSLSDIRRGSFSTSGWNEEPQRSRAERRASQGEEGGKPSARKASMPPIGPIPESHDQARRETMGAEPFPAVTEEEMNTVPTQDRAQPEGASQAPRYDGMEKERSSDAEPKESAEVTEKGRDAPPPQRPNDLERVYTNGYVFPPKLPWTTATVIGLKGFWKWFLTPSGFLITLYGLNVVAWGGMLFLLLCNAAPAMCKPTCNDIQSPRRKWIEVDSQILNSLFCVTGFGLAPWRARDVYWWAWWRLGGHHAKETGIRRLAGLHRGWFRLPGSELLPADASATNVHPDDPAVPIPVQTMPDPPPTGHRAPPTKGWKMDFVVWMNMWNTFFQIVLCFYMWHYDRYKRPSWATGLFVALGCIVAGLGGIMMFIDGKAVKKVEGVPVPTEPEKRATDIEAQNGPAQKGPDGKAKA